MIQKFDRHVKKSTRELAKDGSKSRTNERDDLEDMRELMEEAGLVGLMMMMGLIVRTEFSSKASATFLVRKLVDIESVRKP